jgi:hypothetical protein
MSLLNPEQLRTAIEAMWNYLEVHKIAYWEVYAGRAKTIEQEAKPVLDDYLAGKVPMQQFQSAIEGLSRRKETLGRNLWGFNGRSGQGFFNKLVKVAQDQAECDRKLKWAISVPVDEEEAQEHIRTFANYVKTLGDKHLRAGHTPFFLSFFWQVQDRSVWPIYYPASRKQMTALRLWEMPDDLGNCYLRFKRIQEELAKAFTEASGQQFGLYDVEGVFWSRSTSKDEAPPANVRTPRARPEPPAITSGLPDSFVPPFPNAEPLLARIRQVQVPGTPERNMEDVVKAFLLLLGHSESTIMFQVGHIDVRVNDDKGKCLIVMEVKRSLLSAATRKDALRKGFDYAHRVGAPLVVITDADNYEVYDQRRGGMDYDSKLCGRFQLTQFAEADRLVMDLLRPANPRPATTVVNPACDCH